MIAYLSLSHLLIEHSARFDRHRTCVLLSSCSEPRASVIHADCCITRIVWLSAVCEGRSEPSRSKDGRMTREGLIQLYARLSKQETVEHKQLR